MLLRLAVDYSARDALAHAMHQTRPDCSCLESNHARACIEAALSRQIHSCTDAGDVDLLIRSGGERRLSDFLLWECAYAELVFVDTFWPDFNEQHLAAALDEFNRRERRFGGLPVVA
jgi:undecaprenyl diphosphate synthase